MPKAKVPQPTSLAARAARDALIVARRAQGWSIAEMAEEAQLSQAQIKKILERERDADVEMALLRQDPVEIVENVLSERQRDYALYTHAAVEAAERGNLNALIGAINGRGTTSDRIVKLLQDTGKLPRELGTLRYVIDFRGIAREMVRKLEELEAGEAEIKQVKSFFAELTRLGAPGSQIPEATVVEES